MRHPTRVVSDITRRRTHTPEEPCVAGSIPALGTVKISSIFVAQGRRMRPKRSGEPWCMAMGWQARPLQKRQLRVWLAARHLPKFCKPARHRCGVSGWISRPRMV